MTVINTNDIFHITTTRLLVKSKKRKEIVRQPKTKRPWWASFVEIATGLFPKLPWYCVLHRGLGCGWCSDCLAVVMADTNYTAGSRLRYSLAEQLTPYRLSVQRHDDPPGKLWQSWLSGHWVMFRAHSSTSNRKQSKSILSCESCKEDNSV